MLLQLTVVVVILSLLLPANDVLVVVAEVAATTAGVGVVVLDEDADVLESLECSDVLTVKALLVADE